MEYKENFRMHQIGPDQMHAKISYLENGVSESSGWGSEGELPIEVSLKVRDIQIILEDRIFKCDLSEDLLNQGGSEDMIGRAKESLSREFESVFNKELFNASMEISRKLEIPHKFQGFKGWICRNIGYKPPVWIGSIQFIEALIESSRDILKKSRIREGDWLVISPKTSVIFDGLKDFMYSNSGTAEISTGFNHLGIWRDRINVYTSWSMKDDSILMGRRSIGDSDPLIGAVSGPKKWMDMKIPNNPYDMREILRLGLKVPTAIYSVPMSESSYVSWKFSNTKPSIIKFLSRKILDITFFNYISILFKKESKKS